MATSETEIEIDNIEDLEKLVENATWRDLLITLVSSKKLDPWDIDIAAIVQGYIEIIKTMKILELRIPANIILAAAVLLRLKSEFIIPVSETSIEEVIEPSQKIVPPTITDLIWKPRIQPPKRITLQELMDALENAMKNEEKKKFYAEPIIERIEKMVNANDIDKKINEVYKKIITSADKLGYIDFYVLSDGMNTLYEKIINFFIPVLYLVQKGMISIMQEEFFSSIIIRINADNNGGKR
ncbi:MAG: ScpA family protein [Candidatus Micrarchaeaceae archaeon]